MYDFSVDYNAVDKSDIKYSQVFSGFSVDYNAVDKSDILNIHKYLLVDINI